MTPDLRKLHSRMPVPQPGGLRLRSTLPLLVYLAFVIAGSFAPFHFVATDRSQFLERAQSLWSGPFRILSRSDCLANLLLFVPLGFLAMRLLTQALSQRQRLPAALLVLMACSAFAAATELLQVFFPPRVVSLSDLLAESLGAAVGIVVWFRAGAWFERLAGEVLLNPHVRRLTRPPVALFACIIAFRSLLSFDLTLSPVDLYRKWRDGLVCLWPRWEYWRAVPSRWADIVFFTLLGGAAALQYRQCPLGLGRVFLVGTAFASLLEFLQLFVVSRSSTLDDVVLGGASISLGWCIVAAFASASVLPHHSRPESPHRL